MSYLSPLIAKAACILLAITIIKHTPFASGFVSLPLNPYAFTSDTTSTRMSYPTCLSMSIVKACTAVNELVYSRKIVIFGLSDDPHTLRVMDLLDDGNVQYPTIQLDILENGADMMEAITHMTGRTQVPCIYIDGKFIGGHDHILAMNLDGHLGQVRACQYVRNKRRYCTLLINFSIWGLYS